MSAILAAIVTLVCLWGTIVVMRFYLDRGALSSRVFAFIFAIGWGLALTLFYFVNLGLGSNIELTSGLVTIGLAVGLLNSLLGFPLAYVAHKYVLFRFIKPPHSK